MEVSLFPKSSRIPFLEKKCYLWFHWRRRFAWGSWTRIIFATRENLQKLVHSHHSKFGRNRFHRTNNLSEGSHNRFQKVVGQNHSSLYAFFKELQKEQADTKTMMSKLDLGQPIRAKKSRVRIQNEERIYNIIDTYQDLDEHVKTIKKHDKLVFFFFFGHIIFLNIKVWWTLLLGNYGLDIMVWTKYGPQSTTLSRSFANTVQTTVAGKFLTADTPLDVLMTL